MLRRRQNRNNANHDDCIAMMCSVRSGATHIVMMREIVMRVKRSHSWQLLSASMIIHDAVDKVHPYEIDLQLHAVDVRGF